MGAVISRLFRKRPETTLDILNDLDEKLKNIEEYGRSFDRKRNKIIAILIIYSSAFYVVIASLFYLYAVPRELNNQLFYVTPLLIFPVLIFISKNLVTWYYRRKISKNREELLRIQTMKRKILDEIFESEAFRNAKEIMMKFGIDQLERLPPILEQAAMPARITGKNVNKSSVFLRETSTKASQLDVCTDFDGLVSSLRSDSLLGHENQNGSTSMLSGQRSGQLPRPILPQQRTYIEQFLEYVMGDGPSNRYALICRQCHSHNGMALKEEFEYFAFRCCYCKFWNPAKKRKPFAPKLDSSHEPETQDSTSMYSEMMPDVSEENLTDDGEESPPPESVD